MSLERALACAIGKTEKNMTLIGTDLREFTAQPDGHYFKGVRDQYIKLDHIFNWTQSFFTGMAYWSYRIQKEEKFLKWLYSFKTSYEKKVSEHAFETMHDLGFLYTPYSVALYHTTGDAELKKIGVLAAEALTKRFIPNGNYIRAWGRMDDQIPDYVDEHLAKDHFFQQSKGLAIIDCMMNLPLLYWATEATGHPYYQSIANAHAETTLKYFIRQDGSVYHAYRFNDVSGQPEGPANYCGYSVDSHWARGTAWAIYGFVIAYRYTHQDEYLKTAIQLSKKFIDCCEADGIPVWDFRLPKDQPALYCGVQREWMTWDVTNPENKQYNRDTSAAAIAVCGIFEILKHQPDQLLKSAADKMLTSLADRYTDYDMAVPGLLKCQNGSRAYTSYGDYFFMEALVTKLYGFDNIW